MTLEMALEMVQIGVTLVLCVAYHRSKAKTQPFASLSASEAGAYSTLEALLSNESIVQTNGSSHGKSR